MTTQSLLSTVADVLSIIGFIVGLFVFYNVRAIRRSFILKARIPEAAQELKRLTSDLSKQMGQWPQQSTQVHATLERLSAILSNLLPKLAGDERKRVSKLLRSLRRPWWQFLGSHRAVRFQKDEIWELYGMAEGVIELLKQSHKDSRWA